jgi:hypothetical protein
MLRPFLYLRTLFFACVKLPALRAVQGPGNAGPFDSLHPRRIESSLCGKPFCPSNAQHG